MRKGFVLTFGVLFTSAGLALAQTISLPINTDRPYASERIAAPTAPAGPTTLPEPGVATPPVTQVFTLSSGFSCGPNGCASGTGSSCGCSSCNQGPCLWARGESLLWWLKSSPVPVPLVTAGSLGDPVPGALGQAGTRVLSPSNLNYGPFLGGRGTVGAWVDSEQRFGFEASGFLLSTRTAGSAANSGPTAAPLFVPFQNALTGKEVAAPLLNGGGVFGAQNLGSSTRLWGGNADGAFRVLNSDQLSATLLGGGNYLDLQEHLGIVSQTAGVAGGRATSMDSFATRNQFYGGQLGAKGEVRYSRFFASLQGKVGLGTNHESVCVGGVTTTTTAAGLSTYTPGGAFAQATNTGRNTRDVFTVVPEVQLQVGVDVTQNIRGFVGYDFLYMSDAVRPGDQIDRTLNPTQFGGAGPAGPARPLPQFNASDFWAHGVNAGLQLSF